MSICASMPVAAAMRVLRESRAVGVGVVVCGLLLVGCGDESEGTPAVVGTPVATVGATSTVTGTATAAATEVPTAEPTAEPTPVVTSSTPMVFEVEHFSVPAGARPHDVAPAVDGGVWYTAQGQEALGYLDPATGETRHIHLGSGARPHGVIVGPDGAAWITDGGLNAMVRVDAVSEEVTVFPLPAGVGNANLNTAAFDLSGRVWFTGQNGIYGVLDPASGEMDVWDAPRGRGPYGIVMTPDGTIWYASLAGNHIGRVDVETGEVEVVEPATAGQGARRVWSDSVGRVWVSEWNSGQVSVFDPASGEWDAWRLPGDGPRVYSVYVDEVDAVWLTDFGANTVVRFDPLSESFESFELTGAGANVRQMLGRDGEVWAPESGRDVLTVIRYRVAE